MSKTIYLDDECDELIEEARVTECECGGAVCFNCWQCVLCTGHLKDCEMYRAFSKCKETCHKDKFTTWNYCPECGEEI